MDENSATVNAGALMQLAQEAETVGAKRYAEAYRLLAARLRTFVADPPPAITEEK